ncbi:MAG: cell division protein FtsA [Alphaproteobacteria bacterium]|nr:cell division protein FtsA [Alphaproteobacteria bacterium]
MPWPFRTNKVKRDGIIAALDVGSSKVVCFIARLESDGQLRVIGIGHQLSSGVKGGVITDMEAAQRSIATAVSTAEQMAGEQIASVSVNISGGHVASHKCNLDLPLGGREVTDGDVERILSQATGLSIDQQTDAQSEVIHTIPVGYSLDSNRSIRDPRGMIGQNLGVQLHLITAGFGAVRTLVAAIARCHLEVDQIVVSPYASGLACLVEDEMDLGCTVIDMGAGTTTFAVFFDGQCVFTDGIAMGGAHVTSDIARGLTTTLSHAERLKTLYGNALSSSVDDREIIDVPQVGEDLPEHANHVPKSHLINIIQPRLEEIFELTRNKLGASAFGEIAGRRVVLTGGASQLPGLREMAQRVLDKQVRLGRPVRLGGAASGSYSNGHASPLNQGLAEATAGPAFATVAGLLSVAMQPSPIIVRNFGDIVPGGFFGRLTQWVKQNV